MIDLGTLSKLDPRESWPNEAQDFTPWLAEHLDMLGETLQMDLELVDRENAIGDFAADIVARDLGADRIVVIENQLEPTNHRHLGQLITYAAGLDAGAVIWISTEIRDEHRQALDWLNRHAESATQFFGVVVELLRIDDSKPAPSFRPVAFPNNWRPEPGGTGATEISERGRAYQEFFQRLIDELREKHHFTNARRGLRKNWYRFASGTAGVAYDIAFAEQRKFRVGLRIRVGDRPITTLAFEHLRTRAAEFESQFGETLEWEPREGRRSARVAVYRPGSIDEPSEVQEELVHWAIDRLLRFKKVFGPYLTDILAQARRDSDTPV